jgi:hypothetical protein
MLSGDAANTIFIVIDMTRPEINTRSTILEVSMLTIIDALHFGGPQNIILMKSKSVYNITCTENLKKKCIIYEPIKL